MGFLNWLRDSLTGPSPRNRRVPFEPDPPGPASFLLKPPPDVAAAINRQLDREIDREIARRRGSNPPAPGSKPAAPSGPPAKPQPTGGRLIYGDRDPGPVNPPPPVPPRLPDDLADLPVLPAEMLDGAAAPLAPAEMPSDELLEIWVEEARRVHTASGYHINASTTMAQLAIAWARQQQAQSLQIPPPGADPVATDGDLVEELADLWPGCKPSTVRRTIYQKGRADERTAILRALGVKP